MAFKVFGNLPGIIAPTFMKTKIGNVQYWQEGRLKDIEDAFQRKLGETEVVKAEKEKESQKEKLKDSQVTVDIQKADQKASALPVPQPSLALSEYAPLFDFMENQCNFKMEHADGSFMDHLFFCRDFSAVHYPQISPKILFLHSILGVGTNFFPMEVGKVPMLKGLLTEEE
jgi:hypothetical protein